jgi:hypothetical protein
MIFGLAWAGLVAAPTAWSQQTAALKRGAKSKSDVRTTMVEIEILSETGGSAAAQDWRSVLEPLNVPFSIRRGLPDDGPETNERIIGTLRKVTAVGKMDRTGKVTFADRVIDPSQPQKIKAWIDDLKTYGAQGSPEGQPLWGLSEEQFAAVYEGLAGVTETDLTGQPLSEAVSALPLPAEYPVQWSDAARKRIKEADRELKVRQNTAGFSAATALAIVLNDAGLGFRPNRTPSGSLELLVDAPQDASQVWPVGWPLKLPRLKAAPKLFQLNRILLDDVPLKEVLEQAAEATDVPVIYNYGALDAASGDWETRKILYPPRQATWHTVAKDALSKAKLTFDLWQDEAGRPFLYVTTIKSRRAQK